MIELAIREVARLAPEDEAPQAAPRGAADPREVGVVGPRARVEEQLALPGDGVKSRLIEHKPDV